MRIASKLKDVRGVIHIERHIHDDAIVVSGSLIIDYDTQDQNARIAAELENAAQKINDSGGIVGHIKAAVTSTSTSMISVTDKDAMIKESPVSRVKITVAAIVFLVKPLEAENAVRDALIAIRKRSAAKQDPAGL